MSKLIEIVACKSCPHCIRVMSGFICKLRSKPGQTAMVKEPGIIQSFCPLPDATGKNVATKQVQTGAATPDINVSQQQQGKPAGNFVPPAPAPAPAAAEPEPEKKGKKGKGKR